MNRSGPIPKVRHYGRIDKAALHFGEPPRIRDRKWLDTFEHKECWNCGKEPEGDVVGAHIRWGHEGGGSLKPSDDLVIPLCFKCHQGEPPAEFWANVLKNLARRAYARWKQSIHR
jgi:hypothetical protein